MYTRNFVTPRALYIGGWKCRGILPPTPDGMIIMTNFATLILRKVKEIGLNPTTRFEDLDLNCGLG